MVLKAFFFFLEMLVHIDDSILQLMEICGMHIPLKKGSSAVLQGFFAVVMVLYSTTAI